MAIQVTMRALTTTPAYTELKIPMQHLKFYKMYLAYVHSEQLHIISGIYHKLEITPCNY